MRGWPKTRVRRVFLIVLCGCAVAVLAGLGLFFAQGRYCDPWVGAVGHPYWQFVDGKVYSVVCGKRTLEGFYRRTTSGWQSFYVSRNGVTNYSTLDLGWSRAVFGEPPQSFPRCWHFWMNSHGPLWNPWDK